jgi:hypothetical protein
METVENIRCPCGAVLCCARTCLLTLFGACRSLLMVLHAARFKAAQHPERISTWTAVKELLAAERAADEQAVQFAVMTLLQATARESCAAQHSVKFTCNFS